MTGHNLKLRNRSFSHLHNLRIKRNNTLLLGQTARKRAKQKEKTFEKMEEKNLTGSE